MIAEILERLSKIEIKHPVAFIVMFILITLLMFSGFELIETETSEEGQVPDDIPEIKAFDDLRDKLGSSTSSIVFIFQLDPKDPLSIDDIRNKKVLKKLEVIETQMIDDDFVMGSSSVLSFIDLNENQIIINKNLEENVRTENFVSDDKRIMIATFSVINKLTTEQRNDLIEKSRKIARNTNMPPGVEVKLAGQVILNREISESIGSNLQFLTILGFVGVFLVLFVFFRRFSFVGIAVLPVIIGTIWTFGTLGYVGIPISQTLTGVFSIIIGLGIDFGIHILHRFEEDKNKGKIEKALSNSVKHVGLGLTLTTITTIAGFLALLSGELPLLRDFAIALSFGVFYSLVAAIGLIPPVVYLIDKRKVK